MALSFIFPFRWRARSPRLALLFGWDSNFLPYTGLLCCFGIAQELSRPSPCAVRSVTFFRQNIFRHLLSISLFLLSSLTSAVEPVCPSSRKSGAYHPQNCISTVYPAPFSLCLPRLCFLPLPVWCLRHLTWVPSPSVYPGLCTSCYSGCFPAIFSRSLLHLCTLVSVPPSSNYPCGFPDVLPSLLPRVSVSPATQVRVASWSLTQVASPLPYPGLVSS